MDLTKVELMSPAGSFESMQAAIQGGADAVYFGVEQLNMRARATMNFTVDDLPEIASLCNKNNIRSYLTLNTIVYDHDLSLMKTVINEAKAAGITAVIASDQAVIAYARSQQMEVHISTQLNITNLETVRFYSLFADVMVLSRELSLRQIKSICDGIKKENIKGPSGNLIEIEVFAHGALCMAVSGKCYLSLHTQNASANRGACLQNCRRKYKVIDIEDGHELEIDNEYIMSPKDLCTIDFIDQLLETGVKVLKIEGRGKGPDYVKTVTQCYREAIDSYYKNTYSSEKAAAWIKRMEEVYNRGFWGGYFHGQQIGEWTDMSGSKATVKKIYLGKGNHYYPRNKIAEFKIESYPLHVGDRVMIIGKNIGVVETIVESLHVNNSGAATVAEKGDLCAFPLDTPVHHSDKLYKIVAADAE
ncbi:MAG: U32 family peptidase [Chitinophagaceae bacterium]|nr:U32 family peptidase [Chitinophagaceae bacterium]